MGIIRIYRRIAAVSVFFALLLPGGANAQLPSATPALLANLTNNLLGAQPINADLGTVEPTMLLPTDGDNEVSVNVKVLAAVCYDQNHTTVPNCDVQIRYRARADSGGHSAGNHVANRPMGLVYFNGNYLAGCISPPCDGPEGIFNVNTGPTGLLSFIYIAPVASGIMDFTIINLAANAAEHHELDVQVRQSPLTRVESQNFIGGRMIVNRGGMFHGNGDGYATFTTRNRLQAMTVRFITNWQANLEGPVPDVVLTGLSLPMGGLNDVRTGSAAGGRWRPPHRQHRRGHNADVATGALLGQGRLQLAVAAVQAGFIFNVPDESNANSLTDHYHIYSLQ